MPRLTRRARLRYDHARDRWLLLSPERGLVLNAGALAVVQKLQAGATVEELTKTFGDVSGFVGELAARGLVE